MKALLKRYILIFLLVDLLTIIVIYHINKFYLLFYFILNIVFIYLFIKFYFKVNLININKVINMIKSYIIRKSLSKNERYLKKIKIDTFDGSGCTTHPCILYFEKEFNGYKYWMVHTPYDNNNIELENPSIVVSNDGINFKKPKGIKNPLLPIIKKAKTNTNTNTTYYNDPCLLFEDNKLQVWYRYTIENKKDGISHTIDSIYRITSNDGIHWSKPELMIDDHKSEYLSISIIKVKKQYYLYYFDLNFKIHYRTSNDLVNWNEEKEVEIKDFNGSYWHGEAKVIGNNIFLLFLSKNYKLYLCQTYLDSPHEFDKCNELYFNYYDEFNVYGDVIKYKSSFLIEKDYINLYIPYRVNTLNLFKIKGIKHRKWTMTNTCLSFDNFDKFVRK